MPSRRSWAAPSPVVAFQPMNGDPGNKTEIAPISSSGNPAPKYYVNGQNAVFWNALVICFGIISAGASISVHSFALTGGLILGAAAVWYLGYWMLSNSRYFISPTTVGFSDRFRSREVQFDEIQSVMKETGKTSSNLIFTCKTRAVTIPFDPMDQSWFADVKSELARRQIPLTSSVWGIPRKPPVGSEN